jgi:hypothetical protein
MAKKKPAGAGASAVSPCEQLKNDEIDAFADVPVRPTDQVEWRLTYCNTPIDVKLYRKDRTTGVRNLLLHEHNPAVSVVSRLIPLPDRAGRFALEWDFIVTGSWQVVAEVRVNNVAIFRLYKAHDSKHPRTWGILDCVLLA